ncbi:MAG: VWA-like domain-containing protein [Microcystaceae cyanobacterium]
MTENLEKIISASRLRVRQKSPFFATLSLFANYKPSYSIPTAATDGKDIYFNPDFLLSLSKSQQDGLLLHELLHAALLHTIRRGTREEYLWNIAADIVVNGLIVEQNQFELPQGGIRKPEWEKMSVEEIYELLLKNTIKIPLNNPDLLSQPPEDCRGNSQSKQSNSSQNKQGNESEEQDSNSSQNQDSDSLTEAGKEELKAHWQNALQQAAVIQRTKSQGYLPAGIERQLQELSQSQIDWRSYLWRYLVQTPNDFQGYDRRFVSRKLYLDVIAGQSVQVFVAVDTSGSIGNQELQLFLSEVVGILGAYPHIKCDLYYADAAAYGPYPINANTPIPKPQGGGGTSFVPFFDKVEENRDPNLEGVCVYLTDGYGTFPNSKPDLPTLWVITPGGLEISQIPFGEAVKLID